MTGRDDLARPVPTADAIVVAAGSSTRMGGQDKLRAVVGGRPLLAWTLEAVARAPSVAHIVVVTTGSKVAEIAAAAWLPDAVSAVVAGGARRQDSVAAGVAALPEGPADAVILVHDGARPLVSPDLVDAVARAASIHGAAIPVLPVVDTLKRVGDGRITGDRRALRPGRGADAPGRAAGRAGRRLRGVSARRSEHVDRRGVPAGGL